MKINSGYQRYRIIPSALRFGYRYTRDGLRCVRVWVRFGKIPPAVYPCSTLSETNYGMCNRISRHGINLIILSDGSRALLVNHTLGWHCHQFIASGYLFISIGLMPSTRFQNLSHFAQDILSIPGVFLLFALNYSCDVSKGLAVAVECIFSGVGKTISLQCASLKPETICTLMLVEQWLCLAQGAYGILYVINYV